MLYLLGCLLLTTAACTKDPEAVTPPPGYGSRIPFILKDNFVLEANTQMLAAAGLEDVLIDEGPFTFFALHTDVFKEQLSLPLPITARNLRYRLGEESLQQLAAGMIIRGRLPLKELPLRNNMAYMTTTGVNLYISKYLEGTDTVITYNGIRLVSTDNPASNGLIQVLRELPGIGRQPLLLGRIRSDTALTLFAAALQRSGLEDSLASPEKVYTVLAPVNTAFRSSANYRSIDEIFAADPQEVASLVRYHLIGERYFLGDFFRRMKEGHTDIAMRNGSSITLGGNPATINSNTFRSAGGITAGIVFIYGGYYENNGNIPCNNGVLHKINNVLIP